MLLAVARNIDWECAASVCVIYTCDGVEGVNK